MQMSMFSSEDHLASLSPSPVSERDWQIRVATSCSPILRLLNDIGPVGWYGRTFPVSCRATKEGILEPSLEGWGSAGMGSPTGFLTLNLCEHDSIPEQFPNDGGVCSLSDILETGDVPQRFFLTPKACQGILRRAGKRGKDLPEALQAALGGVAGLPK
jgi:hypothetical protein